MPARREVPRARFSISCLESAWERIREVAERRGVSINDHLVSAGLTVDLGPEPPEAPSLALGEAEQRRLLDRVDRLADSMLAAAGEKRGFDRADAAIGRTAGPGDAARHGPPGAGRTSCARCWKRCSAPRRHRGSKRASAGG